MTVSVATVDPVSTTNNVQFIKVTGVMVTSSGLTSVSVPGVEVGDWIIMEAGPFVPSTGYNGLPYRGLSGTFEAVVSVADNLQITNSLNWNASLPTSFVLLRGILPF